jgi:hypothetical protein
MVKCNKLQWNIRPKADQPVQYKVAGLTTEISWSSIRSSKTCPIRKLTKNTYLNVATGEVLESQHISNRSDNLASIRKSMIRLCDLLNTNVTNPTYCRWITLTYSTNMTDPEKLTRDFTNFMKKLRRRCGPCEYIMIAEPQGRGAWHAHAVLIFPCKAPFISNSSLTTIWGQGFVNVRSLQNINNIGRYVTAYLSDIELCEATELDDVIKTSTIKDVKITLDGEQKIGKRIIKGGRLHLYPPQFNLYRRSKGIIDPIIEKLTASEAEKRVSNAPLIYESTVEISNEAHSFHGVLNRRQYNNKVRKV